MEENSSLAYEMLKEVQRSNKRWYTIAMVELGIIVAIITGFVVGFIIYERQFDYTSESYQSIEGNENSTNFSQTIGE